MINTSTPDRSSWTNGYAPDSVREAPAYKYFYFARATRIIRSLVLFSCVFRRRKKKGPPRDVSLRSERSFLRRTIKLLQFSPRTKFFHGHVVKYPRDVGYRAVFDSADCESSFNLLLKRRRKEREREKESRDK